MVGEAAPVEATVVVEVAGDGLEQQRLLVLGEHPLHAVDVGELIAGGVDHEVVGVALHDLHRFGDRVLRNPRQQDRAVGHPPGIQVAAHLGVEEVHPSVVALGLHGGFDVLHLGVGGMELLQVVLGQIVVGPPPGQVLDEHPERLVERHLEGVVIDLRGYAGNPVDQHAGRGARGEVGVQRHVLEVEHQVVGGERGAVAPLHSLAQVQREGHAVRADVPALDEPREQPRHVRGVRDQELVAPVHHVVGGCLAGVGQAQRTAVRADPVDRLHDQRFQGQPLGDGRKTARGDELGQHRRLVERERGPRHAFVLAEVVGDCVVDLLVADGCEGGQQQQ